MALPTKIHIEPKKLLSLMGNQDIDNTDIALFICSASATGTYRHDLKALINKSETNAWLWDAGNEDLSQLSFQLSEVLK